MKTLAMVVITILLASSCTAKPKKAKRQIDPLTAAQIYELMHRNDQPPYQIPMTIVQPVPQAPQRQTVTCSSTINGDFIETICR